MAITGAIGFPTGKQGFGSQYVSFTPVMTYLYLIKPSLILVIQSLYTFHLMPANYSTNSVKNEGKLLNFFTLTDIHLTDKESPTQAILLGLKAGVISAYSGIMLYTMHVLDAAIQTVNVLHKKMRSISEFPWATTATVHNTMN